MQQIIAQAHQSLGRSDGLVNLRNQEISALNSRLALRDETISDLGEQIAKLEDEAAEYAETKKLHYEALSEEIRGRKSTEAHELRWQQEISNLKSELEDAKATILALGDKNRELERGYSFKPNPVESALRLEIGELRSQLADLQQKSGPASELPEPADLLNQLKGRRKKSKVDLADVATILKILEGEQ